ncbi:hypothetical protein PUNSTDRAFT_98498 [Punctularia strigosozonata HHB-11173 SS5]|uniref:uncharacterized protein n=1 Tax=Punctularia strigosozonata (strain HHB-11173) TaxID=741275 RepID=UPI0004417039|nr:uncharacterized protein PUNSTDRAFT_98498 [Punctularia strigosozonata HHB-11173 SS5]EIN11404.1 hypothetical protein PUNSTDRAFT_98498 [Punctularia strigosozonata HHB-11173 SS5]
MKLFTFLTGLLVAAAGASAEAPQPPEDLVIDKTYVPEDCPVKSANGDTIRVHYTGTLFSNGNKFDSSHDRNSPLPLRLGAGQVISGWEKGLQDMCLNEKRTLTIPAKMAYGPRGFGSVIPPNSALVFDVELVGLDKGHTEL